MQSEVEGSPGQVLPPQSPDEGHLPEDPQPHLEGGWREPALGAPGRGRPGAAAASQGAGATAGGGAGHVVVAAQVVVGIRGQGHGEHGLAVEVEEGVAFCTRESDRRKWSADFSFCRPSCLTGLSLQAGRRRHLGIIF